MIEGETVFLSAAKIAKAVTAGEITPTEVIHEYVDRIRRLNPLLNAYITVCEKEALRDARALEILLGRKENPGPLAGVPLAVKDQFSTRGIRTTNGSRIFQNFIPNEDATVISRLKNSGALLLGKLNMSELALGGTRDPLGGIPRNPWDLERNPGESSSGSGIAVAANLCGASLGEDTGGSGRTPAAYCGVVGLRPTFTRVSRYGMTPMCWFTDTAAPLTKTVEDCALILESISGYDSLDNFTSSRPVPKYTSRLNGDVHGMRIGIIKELYDADGLDKEVKSCITKSLNIFQGMGVSVEEVSIPLIPFAGVLFVAIGDTQGARVNDHILRQRPMDLDQGTRTRLQSAALFPSKLYESALRGRYLLRQQMLQALLKVDILVSATSCYQPPRYSEDTARFEDNDDVRQRMFFRRSYSGSYALASLPAISIPCGFTSSNLPVGLQLGSGPFKEEDILRMAYAYEQSTSWHKYHPVIAKG